MEALKGTIEKNVLREKWALGYKMWISIVTPLNTRMEATEKIIKYIGKVLLINLEN